MLVNLVVSTVQFIITVRVQYIYSSEGAKSSRFSWVYSEFDGSVLLFLIINSYLVPQGFAKLMHSGIFHVPLRDVR